jgi:hypothetical protein
MTFERGLAPPYVRVCIDYLDEQPAGLDTEVFDGLDWGHGRRVDKIYLRQKQ